MGPTSFVTTQLLKDTLDLLDLYNNLPDYQRKVDELLQNPDTARKFTYLSRPIKTYLDILARVSHKLQNNDLRNDCRDAQKNLSQTGEVFKRFWEEGNGKYAHQIETDIALQKEHVKEALDEAGEIYSQEEQEKLNEAEEKTDHNEKETAHNKINDEREKKEDQEEKEAEENQPKKEAEEKLPEPTTPLITPPDLKGSPPSQPTPTPPKIPAPAPPTPAPSSSRITLPRISNLTQNPLIKNISGILQKPLASATSMGSVLARKAFTRFGGTILGGGMGAVGGYFIGGPTGALFGGGLGTAVTTNFGRSALVGAGRSALGLGTKGAMVGARGALAASGVFTGGTTTVLAVLLSTPLGKIVGKGLKWIIIAIVALIGGFIILVPMGLLNNTAILGPFTGGTIGGGGNIASCTFYRGGDGTPGLKFRIPELPALINEVASQAGIPPSLLAALLRVECPSCFYTDDSSYVHNDYDDHNSFDSSGNPVAFGASQFKISTFESVVKSQVFKNLFPRKMDFVAVRPKPDAKPDPNSSAGYGNLLELKGDQILQSRYQDPNDSLYKDKTEHLMRIYSLRDILMASAAKIKIDAGSDPPYNQETVTKIVRAYYGACEYEQGGQNYNYCNDVWQSYNSCQSSGIIPNIQPGDYCGIGGGTSGNVTKIDPIGNSAGGKPIETFKIGNGSYSIAIVGGMNGTSEQQGIDMVKILKDSVGSGKITIPNNITLYFIPEINADHIANWNSHGVDINRNFDSSSVTGGHWNLYGCSRERYKPFDTNGRWCGDSSTYSDKDNKLIEPVGTTNYFSTYCSTTPNNASKPFYCAKKAGDRPFSEPETTSVANFIINKDIKAVFSYRAPLNNITDNNARESEIYQPSRDLAQLMAKPEWLNITYEPYFTGYPVTGQFMDWLNDNKRIGVEIEMPGDTNISQNTDVVNRNIKTIQMVINKLSPGSSNVLSATSTNIPDDQLQSEILKTFKITMEGFNTASLRGAYDKFADISGTNFLKLLQNSSCTNITVTHYDGGAHADTCSVFMRNMNEYRDSTQFNVILIHELSHIIYNRVIDTKNMRSTHGNIYKTDTYSEKIGVTAYGAGQNNGGKLSCLEDGGSYYDPIIEDYPEMVTYYLNIGAKEQTLTGNTLCPARDRIPYSDNAYPEHFLLANKILCGNN